MTVGRSGIWWAVLAARCGWREAVLGWDMGAALALGHALGLNPMVVAELLPELEAVMVRRINEKIAASD